MYMYVCMYVCMIGLDAVQKPVVALYPARLSITAMMTLFGTVQLLVLALFRVRDPSEWVFTWGYELFGVFYVVNFSSSYFSERQPN